MPKRSIQAAQSLEFPLAVLIFVAATAAAATATGNDAEDADGDEMAAHLYSILSPCPADPEESTLEWVVEFWSHVGPLYSPIADLGILLSTLGLLVPLFCTAIGAVYCAHFTKETIVLVYLRLRGCRIIGTVVGLHTQHWASGIGTGERYHTYCRSTIRYRVQLESSNDWMRRDFLLQTIPSRRGKVDLLVSRCWPKMSRIQESDNSLLKLLLLMAQLLGLLLLSFIVGGLLLTMIIEIIPSLCRSKKVLWVFYAGSFVGYISFLMLSEIRHGATAELADQETAGGRQSQGGYEYVPDVDTDSMPLYENRPPTALPIAEPIASIDATTPVTAARVMRSIFGRNRQDVDAPAAIARVVDSN